ncbi:MAG: TonB-dependent receptor, partial [Acidobacteriia bacterium]|nr:TonB-dependent receptor [Terriglobia bacterium]
MDKLCRICVIFLELLLSSAIVFSQPGSGTIRGVVTDNSGAVVPAATLTLNGNGLARTAQSQVDGSYVFQGLGPGQFTVRLTYPGFAPFERSVTVGTGTVQLPIQLALSTEKQEVTVAAETGPAISVEPDNNATALVLKGDDLEALPDDPDDLSDALQALAGPGAGPNGGSLYIDGFTGGQLPPKESIREIRINQNPFSAEYDRLGFGRIEVLTRPGSDKYRGNLFFNETDALFNSRNPFASNKPDFSNRQFGGNFGGPISKRASFFIDFNRRQIQDNAITNAVYVDPTTFQASAVNTAVVTPLRNTTIAPRIDYQLTTNNTLTVRFEERLLERENYGLGRYNLPPPYSELGYNLNGNSQNLTMTETAVLSPRMINETRFQYTRNFSQSLGNEIPSIDVANAFIAGGNGLGNTYDHTHHFELQNYTTLTLGTHTIRFGGRVRRDSDQNNNPQGFNGQFIFSGGVEPVLDSNNQIVPGQTARLTSVEQYQRNLQLQAAHYAPSDIQALGGGPSQYVLQTGLSYVSLVRWDAGPFIQDDWRLRPNLTLSLGLRYEVQTLFSDHSDI